MNLNDLIELIKGFLNHSSYKPRTIKENKTKSIENDTKINLKLERIYLTDTYTIGKFYIDDVYFCDTLEDKYRDLSKEAKIPGQTAIPCGSYNVILSMSNRFKKILPEILDVPYFTSIRIHSGNTTEDTEGCVLVGKNKIKGGVVDSRITLDSLMLKLENKDEIFIEIRLKV